jgi:hypothetical protein
MRDVSGDATASLLDDPRFKAKIADVQLSFLAEMLTASSCGAPFPSIGAWLARVQLRPAYLRAVQRGGANVLSFRRASSHS